MLTRQEPQNASFNSPPPELLAATLASFSLHSAAHFPRSVQHRSVLVWGFTPPAKRLSNSQKHRLRAKKRQHRPLASRLRPGVSPVFLEPFWRLIAEGRMQAKPVVVLLYE